MMLDVGHEFEKFAGEAYRTKTESRSRVRLGGGVLREKRDGVVVSSGKVKGSDVM